MIVFSFTICLKFQDTIAVHPNTEAAATCVASSIYLAKNTDSLTYFSASLVYYDYTAFPPFAQILWDLNIITKQEYPLPN